MAKIKKRTEVSSYNLFNTLKGKRFIHNYLGEEIIALFEITSADYSKGKEYNVEWKSIGRQLLILARLVKYFWEDKDSLDRKLTLSEIAEGLLRPEKIPVIMEELSTRGLIKINYDGKRTRNFTYGLTFAPVKPKEKIDLSNRDKDLNDEKYKIKKTKVVATSEELEHEFEAPANDAVNVDNTEIDEYEKKLSMCVDRALEEFEWVHSIIEENKALKEKISIIDEIIDENESLRNVKKVLEAQVKELEEKNTTLTTELNSKIETNNTRSKWLNMFPFKKANTITRNSIATGDYTTSIEALKKFETAHSL